MKKKHGKYHKAWILWVAMEGLVATFAITQSFLILRSVYLAKGPVPSITATAAGSVLSAIYLPLLVTLILSTGALEHKLSTAVEKLINGLRGRGGRGLLRPPAGGKAPAAGRCL